MRKKQKLPDQTGFHSAPVQMSLDNLKSRLLKEALKTSKPSSSKWRNNLRQTQLVSQISSILLERRDFAPLLRSLNVSVNLTPPLFHQILLKTESNPTICLSFFNWVKSNLQKLQPDIQSHCKLVQMSVQNNLHQQAKHILTSLSQIETDTSLVVDCLIGDCGSDGKAPSFVLEWYSNEGFNTEAVQVFNHIRVCGILCSVSACNALLNALVKKDEIKKAWCVYGAMIRDGVVQDKQTWMIIGEILRKGGRFEKLRRLLDVGVGDHGVMLNVVVGGMCERGELRAALEVFDEMTERGVEVGFEAYGSVLDTACKFEDCELVEIVMSEIVRKRLILERPEYDMVIQKLAGFGKSYSAEMMYNRACDDEEVQLQDETYGSLLEALSKEGRVQEAVHVYSKVLERGVKVSDSVHFAFTNVICKGKPTAELTELVRQMIRTGFRPEATAVSSFVKLLCRDGRWEEAEEILNMVMDEKSMPQLDCCSDLLKHYCETEHIDAAMTLHDKMEQLDGSLDLSSYNMLLDVLFAAGRGDDAVKVHDYMRVMNCLSSESFAVMIRWLCREKEMRKAMKYHDEMLKLGMKPDLRSYKRLISGFI